MDIRDDNEPMFLERDLTWLSFNQRILDEAQNSEVPLMERVKFLAIVSSNLDEFYRVRMPALVAVKEITDKHSRPHIKEVTKRIKEKIFELQEAFGSIINDRVINELKEKGIHLVYDEAPNENLIAPIEEYFINSVACFLNVFNLDTKGNFFPENNKIYLAVTTYGAGKRKQTYIVNIPSDHLPRFFSHTESGIQYIFFLDDIIKINLPKLFAPKRTITCHSFKVTRDSELNLEDEFAGSLARKIEKKLASRDNGPATRFLFEPGLPQETLLILKKKLSLKDEDFISGGAYHNLKDLSMLPVDNSDLYDKPWPRTRLQIRGHSIFNELRSKDILLHSPYHRFDVVHRFFNEAAIDPFVERIWVTLYRVAKDSQIVNALMNASRNGKKVFVFVELKARFDEANNLKWFKRMKEAGVKVIESIPKLKVHAKLALVKRRKEGHEIHFGMLSTGNFNEVTAKYYTDHTLITSHKPMMREVEKLFDILRRQKSSLVGTEINFKHLLVGQFNLQDRFIQLIDHEIINAKERKPASITIKLNNIEDRVLIRKLYEASNANVKISLIVRSVCCIAPGVPGMSENITVRRIVDRYLEHGRVFIFNNDNNPLFFLGSADWMNRNIYRRVEVCFPVYDERLKSEILQIIALQLKDNVKAVGIDSKGNNVAWPVNGVHERHHSQHEISKFVSRHSEHLSQSLV